MMRRIPIFPTLVVLFAVGIMLALGFWQIERLKQKEALLAHYAAAQAMSAEAPFPQSAAAATDLLYRRATVTCTQVTARSAIAGHNASGASGLAHTANCDLAGGGKALIVLGWAKSPTPPVWSGGTVAGMIAPGPRLVLDPPVAGLAANARPDPADLPNNHLSYAVQWFLFALTALVIYGLALRKRLLG